MSFFALLFQILNVLLLPFQVLVTLFDVDTFNRKTDSWVHHQALNRWAFGLVDINHATHNLRQLLTVKLRNTFKFAKFDFLSQLDLISGLERGPKGQHLVHYTPGRPYIGPVIVPLFLDQLWRHVVRRSNMSKSKHRLIVHHS